MTAPAGPEAAREQLAANAERCYFDAAWQTAATLWSTHAKLGPSSIEGWLAACHCAIERAAADPAAAPRPDDAMPTVSNGKLKTYLAFVHQRALVLIAAGDAERSAALIRLIAPIDPSIGTTLARTEPGAAVPAPPPAASGPLAFQRDLDLDDAAARDLVERQRGRRVLLAMRSHFNVDGVEHEGELHRNYRRSLDLLGIACASIETHRPVHGSPDGFIAAFRQLVGAFRPDLIIYDEPLITGITSDGVTGQRMLAIAAEARAELGTRVVWHYPDAYFDYLPGIFETCLAQADLFHVCYSGIFGRLGPAAAARTFCYPHPAVDWVGDLPPPHRARACFAGSINWTNISRLVWWVESLRRGLPIDFHLSRPGQRDSAAYLGLIGEYALSVNLSTRVDNSRIMTGRTIESALAGSTLLEEANDDTAYFMRPYEHYLPFETLDGLAGHIDDLLGAPARRAALADAAKRWVRCHFTGLHYWARLFHRLYEA